MAMSVIWTAMVAASILCGLATGNGAAVAKGALDGAAAGVELCLSMMGVLCLWMGVMKVIERSGLADGLSRLMRPVLRHLYPDFAKNRPVMDAVAADGLCMLVVCNTASLQLIPTTVASLRAAAGSAMPFDILPAVWLASIVSVTVGVGAAKIFSKIWRS